MEGATCCVAVIALCNENGQETPVWYTAPLQAEVCTWPYRAAHQTRAIFQVPPLTSDFKQAAKMRTDSSCCRLPVGTRLLHLLRHVLARLLPERRSRSIEGRSPTFALRQGFLSRIWGKTTHLRQHVDHAHAGPSKLRARTRRSARRNTAKPPGQLWAACGLAPRGPPNVLHERHHPHSSFRAERGVRETACFFAALS